MTASPLRCLFIKPKLIGDTLLLTPTLEAVRQTHPDATIDVLIRGGCESILDGCSAHNRIFTTAPPHTERTRHRWLDQWTTFRAIRSALYDWVFECSDTSRGRYGALFARARRRVFNRQELDTYGSAFDRRLWPMVFSDGVRFDWRDHHAIAGSYLLARDFLQLPPQPPPLDFLKFRFDPAAAGIRVPAGFALSASRLVIHCGTRLASKIWPDDRWVELIGRLAPRFEQIYLSTGPSEPEARLARQLGAVAPAKVYYPDGTLPWSQLAALLQGARLFVGVDTAAMHLATACHCPSVVIWGPTSPAIFGPQSDEAAIVIGDRVVHAPYRATEGHDESRVASRNSTSSVLHAAELLLAQKKPWHPK